MADRYVAKSVTDLSTVGIASTDKVYFFEGDQQITAGLDQSALAAGVNDLGFSPAFTGRVGGGSYGPLKIEVSQAASIVRLENGGGAVYLEAQGAGSNVILRVKQIGQAILYAQGSGTITNLEQASSQTFINDTCLVTNIWLGGGSMNQLYNATGNTDVFVMGGTFSSGRKITGRLEVGGGVVTIKREDTSATVPVGTGAVFKVYGGRLNWWGGSIGDLYVGGTGIVDFSNIPIDITITNLYITDEAVRRSRFRGAQKTVTITNTYRRYGDSDTLVA